MSRPRINPMVYEVEKGNGIVSKISTNTTEEFPKVVFIRTKATLTPLTNEKSYEEKVVNLKQEFENNTLRVINGLNGYDKNHIFTLSVPEKNIKYNKTSHLHYDIFLKPNSEKTLLQLKEELIPITKRINESLRKICGKYGMKN